jgi:hypothetical protein
MLLSEVITLLSSEIICGQDKVHLPIEFICAGDLLSDMLAFYQITASNNTLLITGLNNIQVIRTAEILDVFTIMFVRGKQPSSEVLESAKEKGIVLLVTGLSLYESCGILYSAGFRNETA